MSPQRIYCSADWLILARTMVSSCKQVVLKCFGSEKKSSVELRLFAEVGFFFPPLILTSIHTVRNEPCQPWLQSVASESGENTKQKQNGDFQVLPGLLNQPSLAWCLSLRESDQFIHSQLQQFVWWSLGTAALAGSGAQWSGSELQRELEKWSCGAGQLGLCSMRCGRKDLLQF